MMHVLMLVGLLSSPCDPTVYDLVYRWIVQQTLNSNCDVSDFNLRNDRIEALREICNGQLSSYEKGVKYEKQAF